MDFLKPVAELVGISVGELTTILMIGGGLLLGLVVLSAVVRLAARVLACGCLVILGVVGALYVIFFVL